MLAEFHLMADNSTTVGLISILLAGRCWARRQLHTGIRYVSVAPIHRISLSSVEGVIRIMVAEFYSMADYSKTT